MTSPPDNSHNSRRPGAPCRKKAPAAVGDLNRSNSTANLFLGNSRRSWMSTGNHPHPGECNNTPNKISSTSSSVSRPLPSPCSASAALSPPPPAPPRLVSPPAADPSATPPVAAVSSASPTCPAGMRHLPSHLQQNLTSFRGNNSPVALSSLVVAQDVQIPPASDTPPSLTRSPASRPQPHPGPVEARLQQEKQRQQQQQLQTHLQRQPASSLPSPDPTIPPRSHASPTIAVDRNGPLIASPTTAFPSPPPQQAPSDQSRPRPNDPALGTPPASLSSSNQQTRNARVGPNQPPSHSHQAPTVPIPTAALPPPPQQQQNVVSHTLASNSRGSIITEQFFLNAKYILEAFAVQAGQSMVISDMVELPRIHLLMYACTERDIIYLALHQVYCLSSYAPAQFMNLPGFSTEHAQGLDVIRNLLVDNHRVSGAFLTFCLNFPHPLAELLNDHMYLQALDRVRSILVTFVDGWARLENLVRTTDHPPLVDHMAGSLGIVSIVLQYNIFLCLCRRIPGARIEGQLQDIFIQDFEFHKRNFARANAIDQRRHNNHIVSLYREAIGAMRMNAPRPPSVAASVPSLSASSQAAPAPVSAPVAQQSTAQNISPRLQLHLGAQGTNGITPSSVRSPPVASRSRPPLQANSSQSTTQQRGVATPTFPSQMTGMSSSPVMDSAPSHIGRRDLPQGPFVQQPSQHPQQPASQSTRTIQSPLHPVQMPAGRRVQPPNAHYALPQQLQRKTMALLPPPNFAPVVNTRPNPNRLAIHQAHLRDPVNQFISVEDTGHKQIELLPHMTSFLVEPTVLCQPNRVLKWTVSLAEEALNRRPICQDQGKGRRMLRTLKEGNQTYRLRCIKVPQSTVELNEHSWCVTETTWPTAIYISVNGVEHIPRRKIHNTRDLPLDITSAFQGAENWINVCFILGPAEQKGFTYAVAVEVLTFHSLEHAKALAQPLPAIESQKRICGRLARNAGDEDDELSIVSDDLKVTLVDPFTARLFEVPVRGCHCEHAECFDHETFLQTRALKSGDQSPIEADWRCPICRQDARPQNLVVDGFLANVRKELERTNQCDSARTVQIKADGTWEVKMDEDPSSERAAPQPCRTATKRKSNTLENGTHQRPKIDRSASVPRAPSNQPSTVIVLD
ncbi:hypothetical protein BDW62DRAFT_155317 [Aspergillus aurantiobrunneus]